MVVYWFMFFIVASMALLAKKDYKSNVLIWIIIGVFFSLIIGLRYEVGGDWSNYLYHFELTKGLSLTQALQGKDPGHAFLNWLMANELKLGVYGVNVIYGVIFVIGLIKFSKDQPYPWIAMTVAMPYMLLVVAMGYSRQGMALGLFMWAITYLRKGKLYIYVLMILFAALFHKTAILLLPLGVLIYGKRKVLRLLMILPVLYGGWSLFLADSQAHLIYQYVDKKMQSSGAMIRVVMNIIPSILLFIYKKEWKKKFNDYSFWSWIAIGSILALVFVNFASTAVDRMSLYFIPIQLVVYSRLPILIKNKSISISLIKIIIVLVYALVLFVWLNFASHAYAWLPYQNIIFKDLY